MITQHNTSLEHNVYKVQSVVVQKFCTKAGGKLQIKKNLGTETVGFFLLEEKKQHENKILRGKNERKKKSPQKDS